MSPVDHYVVVGHPVAHSQSPFIHAMFARATGQTMRYGRLHCDIEQGHDFSASVQRFAQSRAGSVGEFDPVSDDDDSRDPGDVTSADGPARGCNVTVPFKFEAYALAVRHTDRARLAQAANVLRFDAEGWLADNTDGAGLVRDIEHNAGVSLTGRRVLMLGAGGAAAGALGPLIAARPAELVVVNRSPERARGLAARHTDLAALHGVTLRAGSIADAGTAFDVLVNASASSLQAEAVPLDGRALRPGALALDMMYGAAARPFIAWAQAQGAVGRDGVGMLVEQAAESFLLWRGVRPDTRPVLAALRHRLDVPAAAP
jgi:shikimate dehydrogenase